MSQKGRRSYSVPASRQFRTLVRCWLEERYPWEPTTKGRKHADEGLAHIPRAVRDLTGGENGTLRKLLQRLCDDESDAPVTDKTVDRVTNLFAKKDREFRKKVSEALWSADFRRMFGRVTADQDFDWAANASPVEIAAMLRKPDDAPVFFWTRNLPVLRQEPEAWEVLEEFRRWAEKKGHHKLVVQQSVRRILGPLAAHCRTEGLMPGWDDLSRSKRLRFIKSGVVREELMLGQEPLHVRAADRFPVGTVADQTEVETLKDSGLTPALLQREGRATRWRAGDVVSIGGGRSFLILAVDGNDVTIWDGTSSHDIVVPS